MERREPPDGDAICVTKWERPVSAAAPREAQGNANLASAPYPSTSGRSVERLLSTATVFHQFLCHTNWFRISNARRFALAPTPFTRPTGFPQRWSPRSRDRAIV